ncbi:hypothetical protein KVR01_005248 [Diaporthe batatas]|uniref:uncharacterized protein n=1 Tax=Diaporthe batatas TaxID=748121 RepID=UPI001D0447F4|nr:uncharacterized protein KVR01_005248 [Diaporthe batatas]KAG8164973.1 hypothetical protein KVR01_005248 [Diaporthe batatas]
MGQEQGITDSAGSGDSKPGKLCSQDGASTSKQAVMSPDSKIGIACNFTDTISIRVKNKYFNVPRDLLIANSTFFDDALNHSVPRKFFLVLDDIDADIFNFFINVLFESSCSTTYKITNPNASFSGHGVQSLLRLWKLSNRFVNLRICLLVEEALQKHCFGKYTPEAWESFYVQRTDDWLCRRLLGLQQCYTICKDESIPFEEDFVIACANCPGQVVASLFDHLDPDFKTEVVKSFAIRVADPKVAQRKRAHEDEGESQVPKKRRL